MDNNYKIGDTNEIKNTLKLFIDEHNMEKPVNLMTLATICTKEIPRDNRHTEEARQNFLRAVSVAAKKYLNAAYTTTREDFDNIGLWIMSNSENLIEQKSDDEEAL